MRNKIVSVILVLIMMLILLQNISFATDDMISENQIIVSSDIISYDNLYEVNEEIHKEQDGYYKPDIYMSNSSTLSFRDYIFQEIDKHNEAIDIRSYNIPASEIKSMIAKILSDPLSFPVSSASFEYVLGGMATTIRFNYIMTAEEIKSNWKIINDVSRDYLEGIKSEWNDLEKIIYTNNYLCKKCEYADDTTPARTHTLVAALVDERPVCDGYSKAFIYLLKQVGIESTLVTSSEMVHAWNIVKLDGNYYHVDVTWNDAIGLGIGKTQYTYFLVSDGEFQNTREHHDWVSDYEATSTKYDNNDWLFVDNYLIYKDNYWYYIKNPTSIYDQPKYSFELYKTNYRTGETTQVTVNTTDYIFWFPGLTTDETSLYYTTRNAIWIMDFDGTGAEEVYRLSDNSKILYSVEYEASNKLYYDTTDLVNGGSSISSKKTNMYTIPEPVIEYTYESINENEIKITGCNASKVTNLKLPNEIDGKIVTEIGDNAFKDKIHLEKITIPKTVVGIASNAFEGCSKLSIIYGNKNSFAQEYAKNQGIKFVAIDAGDVNGDGKVTMFDCSEILLHVKKIKLLTAEEIQRGDINGDGKLTMFDCSEILLHVKKIKLLF